MHFRRKALRTIFVIVVIIAIAPVALLISYYIGGKENSIYLSLQSKRFGLTQLSNEKHVLNTYALRLKNDTQLSDAVKQNLDKYGLWQTPAQQVRIQFTDGIENYVESNNNVLSAALEWLDGHGAKTGDEDDVDVDVDVQEIWLDSIVKSVPHAVDLIYSIKAMAKPYPVQVHGCSYERSRKAFGIAARCLLVLNTWVLPLVKIQDNQSTNDASNHQLIPIRKTRTAGAKVWRIFNTENLSEDTPETGPSTMQIEDQSASSKYRESKAIINGPAGRLVIHAYSE